MAKKTTNDRIIDLDKKVDKRFQRMEDMHKEFRHELRRELQPIRDFAISVSSGSNLTKDLFKIIFALISLIGVLYGGSKLT